MPDSTQIQTIKPAGTSAAQAQAIQGVSGGLAVPVSLSGSVTIVQSVGTNLHMVTDTGSVTDVSDRAARLLGVVYGSQAQQLKQTAANFNLQSELFTGATAYDARSIRALTSSDVVSAAQSGTWTVQPGNTANTTAWKVDGSAVVQPVSAPTLTKGTQAANGWSVQSLKDAGRVNIGWTAEVAGAATTEGLLTVTESRDGAATSTFTSKVVTSGKRMRITSLALGIETLGTGTAPQRVYVRLRFNTAGAVTTGSPLQGTWLVVNNAAIVKSGAYLTQQFPDGIEFLGDGTKQIGFTITFPDWVTTTATVQAKFSVSAFEY